MTRVESLIEKLAALEEADVCPFPYADCRKLQRDAKYAALVPDLDVYLSDLAGHRSWGKRILQWSDDKIAEVAGWLSKSFFEQFPVYAQLEWKIRPSVVPELHALLARAEKTRLTLLELLEEIRRLRCNPERLAPPSS